MNIPALRFPGFEGEWDVKKVGELCDSIVPGRNKPTSFEGNIPWITTPDIQHHGTILNSKNGLCITKEEAKIVGSKIVPRNSVIISCVGDLGLAAINGTEIIINQQLHAFIPREGINHKFLLYSLSNEKEYMDRVATKTAVPYMNKENCNSIPITFPTLPEQNKIATFLSAVDEKLQQLKQEKAHLVQYKKGVMQRIFNYEIRFKDDDGSAFPEWEEKSLGEVGEFQTSSVDKLSVEGEKEVFLVNYMNVYRHEEISLKTINNLQVVTAKDSQIVSNNLKKGDILFTPSSETPSDIGHSVVIFEDLENCVYSYHLIRFRPKIEIDILYSHYFCNIPKVLDQLSKLSTGSTRFTVSIKSFCSIVVNLPSLPEQTKIANFLSAIGEKITNITNQITLTEQWKKGLLQGMFV